MIASGGASMTISRLSRPGFASKSNFGITGLGLVNSQAERSEPRPVSDGRRCGSA
jgi:hypothetical protein